VKKGRSHVVMLFAATGEILDGREYASLTERPEFGAKTEAVVS